MANLDELLNGGVRIDWDSAKYGIDGGRLVMNHDGMPMLSLGQQAVIHGMPNDVYHADRDYVSSSSLKIFATNPSKYRRIYVDRDEPDRDDNDSLRFGSLVHCLLLEPQEFDSLYEIHDHGPDGEPLNLRTNLHKSWLEANERISGKKFLRTSDMEEAMSVMAAVGDNPLADSLLTGSPLRELSLFCVDQEQRVRCKAKMDAVTMYEGTPTIIDVKTTSSDASPEGWSLDIARWGYDVSAALYCQCFRTVTGVMPRFIWLVIQKDKHGDHQCVLHEMAPEDMLLAIDEVRYCLSELALTTFSKFESPYSNKINRVRIPAWRFRSRRQ